jgi:type I restriction enzyme, S subunit
MLESFQIPTPDIITQQSIVKILSTYDALIETNRRRIRLLEESARLLYKEWFVELRFPGHENAKIVDGLPEGWSTRPLGEVGALNYGKALKESERVAGDIPVYGSSGIIGENEKSYTEGPAIIVGRKGNVGSIFWSPHAFWPIDTVYFIDAEHSSLYLLYTLDRMIFQSSDVAVPGLNREYAHSRLILRPRTNVERMFEDYAASIHFQIETLQKQISALARARDLLLPKLMSGEIEV